MEEYKKKLKSRQLLLLSGILGTNSTVSLTNSITRNYMVGDAHSKDFILGFQASLITVLIGFLFFSFIKTTRAIRNPERLKNLYIAENDERRLFIMQKSGFYGMNLAMYGLAIATIAAGYFNYTVFFSLLGACLFVGLIRVVFKVYYRMKY